MEQQGRGGKKAARPNSTGTTVPYETMDVPGIMELHRYVTNELMNEKHNVFMWTIDKYPPQTEEIMSLLGYKLHARLIWDKGNDRHPPTRCASHMSTCSGSTRREISSSRTRTSVEHSPRYSERTANGITARSRNVPIRCWKHFSHKQRNWNSSQGRSVTVVTSGEMNYKTKGGATTWKQ